MQSSDFNRSQGLKGVKEKGEKNKLPWDKILYLIIFFSMMGVIAYYFIYNVFWFSGKGIVTGVISDVTANQKGKLMKVPYTGTKINPGDTIALYEIGSIRYFYDTLLQNKSFNTSNTKDILRMNTNAQRRQSILLSLSNLDTLIHYYNNKLFILKQELILGVISNELLNQTQMKLVEANTQRNKLLNDLDFLKQEYLILIEEISGSNYNVGNPKINKLSSTFIQSQTSQLHGSVYENIAKPGNIIYPGMPLFRVEQRDSLYISYAGTLNDMQYLKIGSKVNIHFSDGKRCVGIISNLQKNHRVSSVLSPNSVLEFQICPISETKQFLIAYRNQPVKLHFSKFE